MARAPRGPSLAALALTAAVHAVLLLALAQGARKQATPQAASARALTVTMVKPPPAPAPAPGPVLDHSAPAPAPPLTATPAVPLARDAVHYYFPEELDRELVLLIDRSGEDEIDLEQEVVMHLFVDPAGRVADILFEGAAPLEVQERLRAAFMTMEFLPGLQGGRAVPARIKIAVAPHAPAPEGG